MKTSENVKFVWNGIKVNGEFHKGHWSNGPYTAASGLPAETITMYAAHSTPIPRIPGLTVKNDTDIMTDYFETDTVRIFPDSPYYEAAKKAMTAGLIHDAKHSVKHYEKWLEKVKGTHREAFYMEELRDAKNRLNKLIANA